MALLLYNMLGSFRFRFLGLKVGGILVEGRVRSFRFVLGV